VDRRLLIATAAGAWIACALLTDAAVAQTTAAQPAAPPSESPHALSSQDIELLRKDLRSQKKQLIAQNLKLSDSEATKFWPIYDQYVAELAKINDKKYSVIQQYADKYATLSDQEAMSLIQQWQEVDIAAGQLRLKYMGIVAKAIGGRKAAAFGQLDRRIALIVELQLASRLPMVQ
jgi:hypothetical protein